MRIRYRVAIALLVVAALIAGCRQQDQGAPGAGSPAPAASDRGGY